MVKNFVLADFSVLRKAVCIKLVAVRQESRWMYELSVADRLSKQVDVVNNLLSKICFFVFHRYGFYKSVTFS